MLQEFVQSVSSVLDVCCKYFLCCICFTHMLQKYVSNVSTILFLCCSKCFHVARVLSGCCICFTHMLQVYVLNVSSASDLCCIQVFHVASVSCFRGMFRESWGHSAGAGGRGAASWRATDGAHVTPRILRTGRACPHPGSRVSPARREEGVRGKEWRAQPGCGCGRGVRRGGW